MNTVMFDPPQFVSGVKSVPYQVSCCCIDDHEQDQLTPLLQVNISFTPGSLLPTLPGEMFLCVFSNEEKGITFNTTLSQAMSCDLTFSLPALTDIKLGIVYYHYMWLIIDSVVFTSDQVQFVQHTD